MANNNSLITKTVQYNGQIFDRIRVLGQGSFGTAIVYKRQHDNTLVVLKEIDLVELRRESHKLAAIQEARIMSNLSHQNIIKYYNAYTTDSHLIIEMEYARLGTLSTYLTYQNQPLNEREVLEIFRQILFGLDYLHSKSIVHLDLKMANIFVTSEGTIKIGDFGIAKFICPSNDSSPDGDSKWRDSKQSKPVMNVGGGQANSNHCQLGTLAYSSPERCLGEMTDFKSDIWSLGCILYELITLKPLFASESLAELILSITRVQVKPIQRTDIRPDIKSLFNKMVSRLPSDRPSSSELVELTDQILLQFNGATTIANKRPQSLFNRVRPFSANQNKPNLFRQQNVAANIESVNQHQETFNQPINYKHSLLYQVRLNSQDIQVDRVNLPQSKRIRAIAKGRSHYLVLTYDEIVYGWGTKHCGQLGACNLFRVNQQQQSRQHQQVDTASRVRCTRSARNSLTARDLQIFSPSFMAHLHGGSMTTRPISLTQPSSLSSSTQTISNVNNINQRQSSTSLMADYQERRSQKQHFELLASAQPATRPIVVSELNKRKISHLAAGNDFSVFLTRTGILLTCGDGSRGCLGRGDLNSSFTPCMVDGLLNMDVVDVACGPEHVVAICSNGQAFAWGNQRDGRLGLIPTRDSGEDLVESSFEKSDHYVTRPQLVGFPPNGVFIKSVFCGDRCTIFIDSNQQCWACGENRSNRLGLDRKRHFKRTIIVESSPAPIPVLALLKERIVSCSIGANHASYLTADGKMIILGQDIDHSYRLRANLASGNDKRSLFKRGASSLYKLSSKWSLTSDQINSVKQNDGHTAKSLEMIKKLDHELLIKTQLENDRLRNFKSLLSAQFRVHSINKFNHLSRSARNHLESYLKKSRALKRMPFDDILDVCCTSNFTLVLTNDNRVYFWGTRTHATNEFGDHPNGPIATPSIEPQLVASCSDECFIKIGSTNNSLMESVQSLGSDQPIILARNPKLMAHSLRDLWILDYEPQRSSRSISQANARHYCPSSCSKLSRNSSLCSLDEMSHSVPNAADLYQSASSISESQNTELESEDSNQFVPKQKHDAIIEPQPIVSLYVPSMFNHNNCTLQLVNLFCFDEDRFFLVLDTTVKFQLSIQQASAPMTALGMKSSSGARRASSYSFKAHQQKRSGTVLNRNQRLSMQPNSSSRKLNIVQELRSGGSSSRPQSARRSSLDEVALNGDVRAQQLKGCDGGEIDQDELDPDGGQKFARVGKLSSDSSNPSELEERECCRDYKADKLLERDAEIHRQAENNADGSLKLSQVCQLHDQMKVSVDNSNDKSSSSELDEALVQVSPVVSGNCLSLEEPLSMSTFAPGFAGDNLAIVGRVSPDQDCETLRRLSFEQGQQLYNFDQEQQLARPKPPQQPQTHRQNRLMKDKSRTNWNRRSFNRARNRSESTVVTGGFEDDTTSMPTWVRNEYDQQMCVVDDGGRSSEIRDGEGATCVSEVTLTDAMSSSGRDNYGSDASISSGSRTELEDSDHFDGRVEDEQTTEVEGMIEMNLNSLFDDQALRLTRSAIELSGDQIPNDEFELRSSYSQPELREPFNSQNQIRSSAVSQKVTPANSPCFYASFNEHSNDRQILVRNNLFDERNKSLNEIHGALFTDQNRSHRSTRCLSRESEPHTDDGGNQLIRGDKSQDLKREFYVREAASTRETNNVSLKFVHVPNKIELQSGYSDKGRNKSGLRKNLMSQSAHLTKSPATDDSNNNPIDYIELRQTKTRRRSDMNGSRSSLGSLRKSLARIFC